MKPLAAFSSPASRECTRPDTMPGEPRARGRHRRFGPAVALALGLFGSLAAGPGIVSEARAQAPSVEVELQGPFDDEERALYAELQGRTPISTRTHAEAYLVEKPDSIVAHYVLGSVLRRAEGDLAQSMRHLGRARELYEGRWPTDREHTDAPWRLHRELLFAIQQVAGELEQHEYRISILEFHDQLYDPNLSAERAWPLLQLGRIDEARTQARAAIEGAGSVQRSLGQNALCAIEGRAGSRRAWFDACIAAFEEAQRVAKTNDPPFAPPDELTPVAVHAYNAALAARASLRPDEVERLALAGARRLEFTAANPWALLVRLFLAQGRGEEATRALLEAERWRGRQPPALRDQIRADQDALNATLLLVAGEADAARGLVDRAVSHPDRRGLTVTTRAHTVGAHALLRRVVRRTQAELRAERESYGEVEEERWQRARRWASEGYEDWVDAGRVEKGLADEEALDRTLASFVHGGLEPLPAWLVGELVEVTGAGVVGVALEALREDAELSGLEAYYDAYAVDLAWARGDEEATWRAAEAALDALPTSEVMLRARVAALGGMGAADDGENARALEFFETAFALEPGVLRRLGIALPARVESSGDSPVAASAAQLLRASPRLDAGEAGFTVRVDVEGRSARVCIEGPSGAQLGCHAPVEVGVRGDAPPQAGGEEGAPSFTDDPEAFAAAIARGFHRGTFAMPLGLSSLDMGSLDGSATVGGEAARQRLERTLDTLTRD